MAERRPIAEIARSVRAAGGKADVHIHTAACDDATQTPDSIVRQARELRLRWITVTAHVRASTDPSHVARYIDAVEAALDDARERGAASELGALPEVTYSVETKICDTSGTLDVPNGLDARLATLHLADHQFPLDSPTSPATVAELLRDGQLTPDDVWTSLTDASVNALLLHPGSILAHPLSVIPKVGMDPQTAPESVARAIAAAALKSGAIIEVNNKWSCPTSTFLTACLTAGVPVVVATDAHHDGDMTNRHYSDALGQ